MITLAADVTRPREHGWEHDGDAALLLLAGMVIAWLVLLARRGRAT